MKILLAGGTGLIGTRLAQLLQEKGHVVHFLTRHPKGGNQFHWDPAQGQIDEKALVGVEAIINLAGAGIADKRWTQARKALLVESRVQSAALLLKNIGRMKQRPHTYVAASAIGYYGNTGERWCRETDQPADNGFLSECCVQWENANRQAEALGLRTAILRIGIVLSTKGGALPELIKPLRFGVGAYFADGRAWYAWIHLDDMCRQLIWAVESPHVHGVYNAVAPNPVRVKTLIAAAAKAMHRSVLPLPAPAFALRLLLGEMSAVVLNSNRVSNEKALKDGFVCQYRDIEGALEDIL